MSVARLTLTPDSGTILWSNAGDIGWLDCVQGGSLTRPIRVVAWQAANPEVRGFTRYEDLLDSDACDAVMLATPMGLPDFRSNRR